MFYTVTPRVEPAGETRGSSRGTNWMGQLPRDRFTHISATYDGRVSRFYIAEHLEDEVECSGDTSVPLPSPRILVGNIPNSTDGLVGAIDEIRISNIARY